MGSMKQKPKKERKEKIVVAKEHKMFPLHLFHNEAIDRWVVLMECKSCVKLHVFYPFS